MALNKLDGVLASTNYTLPTVAKLENDDGSYVYPSNEGQTATIRVSFPTPGGTLSGGQSFTVIGFGVGAGIGLPTMTIALRETGSATNLASTAVGFIGDIERTKTLNWDASLLSDPSGSKVECYISVTPGVEEGSRNVALELINWTSAGVSAVEADIAFNAPRPTISASGTHTEPVPQYNADIGFSCPRPTVDASASFLEAQYAGDIDFSAPRPTIKAAADFMPVSGTTGWIRPASPITNYSDSGVTVSNVSNIISENASVASVSLQRTGGATLQRTKSLTWNWLDPANYPEGAIVEGIEFVAYVQQNTANDYSHFVYPYELYLGANGVLESANVTNNPVLRDDDASPLWDNPLHWGGETELHGVSAGTLVSDFLAEVVPVYGDHARFQIINNGGFADASSTVLIAHAKMKIWWSVPNYIDMAADPSFSLAVSDSAPLQKIRDLEANATAGVTVTTPISGNPINMYSDFSFSAIIEPPTISEGATYIDMAVNFAFNVLLDANVTRIRDMFANAEFGIDSYASVGFSNALSAEYHMSVTMDPQLHRYVELQTDALSAWFEVTMNADGLVGDMSLLVNIPIGVTMNVDGLVVNWALYAEAEFSVTASASIGKMTNLSSDMTFGVTMEANLYADINMYSDMTIDGLLFNSEFVRLPVPAPEERTMYMKPKGRTMKIPAKGRKIILTSN